MKNIGLIGYGGMGKWHTELIASMPEHFKIFGIYDINEKKLEAATKDGFKIYSSLDLLLSDSAIDTVIVAVPNNFHKDISIAALKANKHVICEKPVMMNTKELEEVLAVSEEVGKLFCVHQNRRWDKDYRIACETINTNTIGEPYYIESRVQGAKGIPGDWRCVKIAGGGMLFDWGVHLIDQLLCMVKSPVIRIYANLLTVQYPEVDDNFKIFLEFANGVSALCEVSTNTFIPLPRWHISGKKGTLQINDWECNGSIVRANQFNVVFDEGIVYTAAGPTRTMAPRAEHTLETIALPEVATDATDYYRNFHKATTGEEALFVTTNDMLRVMKVIDTAFESSELKKSIDVLI
ncbi:MAG: Gfo/Idh/MocA family protein [Lachnospiraceae bacterium]